MPSQREGAVPLLRKSGRAGWARSHKHGQGAPGRARLLRICQPVPFGARASPGMRNGRGQRTRLPRFPHGRAGAGHDRAGQGAAGEAKGAGVAGIRLQGRARRDGVCRRKSGDFPPRHLHAGRPLTPAPGCHALWHPEPQKGHRTFAFGSCSALNLQSLSLIVTKRAGHPPPCAFRDRSASANARPETDAKVFDGPRALANTYPPA